MCSLPYSQKTHQWSYSESDESSPLSNTLFFKPHFDVVPPSTSTSPVVSTRRGFAHSHAQYRFCSPPLIWSNVSSLLWMHKCTVCAKLLTSYCHSGWRYLPLGFKQLKSVILPSRLSGIITIPPNSRLSELLFRGNSLHQLSNVTRRTEWRLHCTKAIYNVALYNIPLTSGAHFHSGTAQ